MNLKLENLAYQQQAIDSIVGVFDGQERNTFDNATAEGIRFNYLRLTPEHLADNVKAVAVPQEGMDTDNSVSRIARLKNERTRLFICLECAVDTTKKWNLKHLLGDRLVAF